MTPERWQKVKTIFQGAIQRAPDERSVCLSRECGNDEALRREVESLLASHERDGSFIDSPAYDAVAKSILDESGMQPGQIVGAYEIVSLILVDGIEVAGGSQTNNLRTKDDTGTLAKS